MQRWLGKAALAHAQFIDQSCFHVKFHYLYTEVFLYTEVYRCEFEINFGRAIWGQRPICMGCQVCQKHLQMLYLYISLCGTDLAKYLPDLYIWA